jgi:hypothetical protein
MNHGWPRGESEETSQSLVNMLELLRWWVLTAPVLLVVVVRREDLAARDESNKPRRAIDDGVAHDTCDETVRDRVRERHEHERDKCGDAITGVVPVDGEHAAHHHAAHENERTASCPGRDRCEDGREEERDKEEAASCDGGDTCATSFLNTGLDNVLASASQSERNNLHLTRRMQ